MTSASPTPIIREFGGQGPPPLQTNSKMAEMAQFEFFEVGGAVRDSLMGLNSEDVDFTVVLRDPDLFQSAEEAFNSLVTHLKESGFKGFSTNNGEFILKPEFFTVKALVPEDHPLRQRTPLADFVLARKDGPYSDGRRPDWVKPGTLLNDLERRDFASGAIAKCIDGTLIDPFNGVQDIQDRKLRFVGDPYQRIKEDGLRTLRGLRFQITKGFIPTPETYAALRSDLAIEMLECVSKERVREELNKMFKHSSVETFNLLSTLPNIMISTIFSEGLRLEATLKS